MKGLPYFRCYPADLLGSPDVAVMSAEAVGGYVLLLCYQWQSPQCRLPGDRAKLAQLARLDPDSTAFAEVCRKFQFRRGFARNARLWSDFGIATRRQTRLSAAGSVGGKARPRNALPSEAKARLKPGLSILESESESESERTHSVAGDVAPATECAPTRVKAKPPREAIDVAEELAAIVRSRHKLRVNGRKLAGWAEHVRRLADIDGVDYARQHAALAWYGEHHTDAYVPVIECGLAWRDKYPKLAAAMERDRKQAPEPAPITEVDEDERARREHEWLAAVD